ncbi:MAG: hypothetical protein LBE98_02440 [Puniceicoccales bacterium]|nr:hypothetical protein [Puniceicoccales bacterium]
METIDTLIARPLRTGESFSKTIGDILIQVKSNRESAQALSDVDFKALTDRDVVLKELAELRTLPLAQSQAFVDKLLEYGPEGARCLRFFIERGKLPNFDLSSLPPDESNAFADRLLRCGSEGAGYLGFLVEQRRLPNFDLSSLPPDESNAFADRLLGYGLEGVGCLKNLLAQGKLENFNPNNFTAKVLNPFVIKLTMCGSFGAGCMRILLAQGKLKKFDPSSLPAHQSKNFADKMLGCGPDGAWCLKFFIEQGKLPNLDLSSLSADESNAFADRLLGCGLEGVGCLRFFIEKRKLPKLDLSSLSAVQSKAFMDKLLGCGPDGAWCLVLLIKQCKLPKLDLSSLSAVQSKAFADRLLGYGLEGVGCLKLLVEKRKLPKLYLSSLSPDQSIAFADRLLGYGPEGVGCLKFFIKQGRLPNFDLRTLPPDQSIAFADRLLGYGLEGVGCLKFFIEQGRLPNLDLSRLSAFLSKAFADKLLKGGPEGVGCLRFLVEQGRLPNFGLENLDNFKEKLFKCGLAGAEYLQSFVEGNYELSSFPEEESKDLAETFIHGSKFGIKCLKSWVERGTLPNLKLCQLNEEVLLQFDLQKTPKVQVAKLVKALLVSPTPSSLSLLGELIEWNKLSFDPSPPFDLSLLETNPNNFAVALAGGGAFSVNLLTQLMDGKPPKLDLRRLSADQSNAFADRLLGCSSSSAGFLIELIDQNKLPNLSSPEAMKARVLRFQKLHSTFGDGIKQAFFGRTDSIDDALWNDVRARLTDMPLREARGIWQTIANGVATDCFDDTGHVDVERLKEWMEFLGNAATFRTEPYYFIPHAELMRSQMHRVCECLFTNQNGAMDQLNAANGITVGEHGQSILATMSNGREPPLRPAEAILTSLFAPHRQQNLPACTMHSLINAEIRNHPERLIKMYAQMLEDPKFTFPSGYAVQQQPIVDGFITVDLINGGKGKDKVFEDIMDGNPAEIDKQIKIWQQEGIEYVKSANPAESYKLKMPIHNMTDLLFAHLFQASNFGDSEIQASDSKDLEIERGNDYGTMRIYAKPEEAAKKLSEISWGDLDFPARIAELKEHAETQWQLGHRYMRMSTDIRNVNAIMPCCHAENIDIPALRALDLDHMEPGKAYPIGDRDWGGIDMSQDIPRLAVRKTVDDGGSFSDWGTLYGHRFAPGIVFKMEVY